MRRDEDETVKCGVACYHPRWARRLANPKLFCVVWCLAIMTQSITGVGLLTAVLSTIETRFQLESKDLGVLASAADIGCIIGLAVLSYYGGRPGVNRPKILGICTLVFAIGSFAFGFAHVMTPAYEVDSGALTNGTRDEAKDVCTYNGTTANKCAASQESSTSPYAGVFVLLCLSQFVLGIGLAPTYPLGTTYVDDHVTKKALPFYLGLSYTTYGAGPTLGLFLGGYTLSLYVDIDKGIDPASLGLFPGSPLWVGAWWLGSFVMAGLLGLVASWLLLFPAELKKPKKESNEVEEDGNKMLPETEINDPPSSLYTAKALKQQAKDMMLSVKKVFTNWVFTCINMAFVCFVAAGTSFSFVPKYMEIQLGMHKAQASYLLGMVFLPSALFGLFAIAIILRRFQLGPRGCLYMIAGLNVLSVVVLIPAGFISCPRPPIAGVNIPYGQGLYANVTLGRLPGGIALMSPCNADCGCRLDNYRPVCASDGITYFSGCHAGCHESHSVPGPRGMKLSNYSNCGCVRSRLPSITGGGTRQLAGTQAVMAASEGTTRYSVWSTADSGLNETNGATVPTATSPNFTQTDLGNVAVISDSNTNPASSVQMKADMSAFSIQCPTKCNALPPFLALLTLNFILRAMFPMAIIVCSLRVLSPDTKTLGVGLQSLMTRLLGQIPAPIFIGALIDRSCELWSSSCGVRGACLLYDMPMNRFMFIGVQVLLTSVTVALLLVAIHLYNRQEAAKGKSQAPGLTTRDIATSMGSLAASISSLNNIGARSHDRYTRERLHDQLTDC
ncbi:solute carrier organic anion transporter family member 3A1-like isoform X2 [Branchiostoma lanceolatum]|uniref:solute carrier organic anion transporter family member 3A1-like isoform X2 n=1 Tax=Branchiostoma lanceolatum TaxID=7740 RepID=UPI0034569A4B